MGRKDIAICILNYNGHVDTIECLESIFLHESLKNYTILVMDNGSNKDSVAALKNYFEKLKAKKEYRVTYSIPNKLDRVNLHENEIVFIESKENYGFADGNNRLANYAITQGVGYIALLNNDTTLIMSSINHVKTYMDNNSNYDVVTSNITFYDNPNKVWSAGGHIFWGVGKYYGTKQVENKKKSGGNVLPISFVTGCFMVVRSQTIKQYGLFTDLFFFGEEDFDFSMRMKKNKVNMCCLLDSKIYHKVGGTKKIVYKDINNIRKSMTGYLNRFINMKQHYAKTQWKLWRIVSSIYIFLRMVIIGNKSISEALSFVKILNKLSIKHNSVTKPLYEDILNGKYI